MTASEGTGHTLPGMQTLSGTLLLKRQGSLLPAQSAPPGSSGRWSGASVRQSGSPSVPRLPHPRSSILPQQVVSRTLFPRVEIRVPLSKSLRLSPYIPLIRNIICSEDDLHLPFPIRILPNGSGRWRSLVDHTGQNNACVLPEDLKNSYLMTDGFHMTWSVKSDDNPMPLGSMAISGISMLNRLGTSPASPLPSAPTLADWDDASEEGSDKDQPEKPPLDSRSLIVELDPCRGNGKACLVHKHSKPGVLPAPGRREVGCSEQAPPEACRPPCPPVKSLCPWASGTSGHSTSGSESLSFLQLIRRSGSWTEPSTGISSPKPSPPTTAS